MKVGICHGLQIKEMIKIDIQRLILKLIQDHYLKENFHTTSYATVCHIVLGPNVSYIYDQNCIIMLDTIESHEKTIIECE